MQSAPLRIGTSSWSSPDWRGTVYATGSRPVEFLEQYARKFDTVECDATFYAVPSERTVDGWRARTPEGFLMAAKLPREITHDRGLVDCAGTLKLFLSTMSRLGDRLGPIVAQFAYVAKGRDAEEYATGNDFRRRLAAFLATWPAAVELAVEVRNPRWLVPQLLDLLREKQVALVLPAIYTMPGPERLFRGAEALTTDLVYVRFLGDHRRMDELVGRLQREGKRRGEWSELAVDRSAEMHGWVKPLRSLALAGHRVMVYFNNHYAGYAPGSVDLFNRLWNELPPHRSVPASRGGE